MQQEMTIAEMKRKMAEMTDRLGFLEKSKRALEDKTSSSVNEHTQQIASLEKVCHYIFFFTENTCAGCIPGAS
jgi:hypothetical protein